MQLPPEVTGEPVGSFAWTVLHERHPALVARVRDAHPYPPEVRRALDELTDGLADRIRPPAPDGPAAEWVGRRWDEVPFLAAEGVFYAALLAAVGWAAPGPWRGLDPFAFLKRAELAAPSLPGDLAALDELAGLPARDRTAALLRAALWANRADLGFRIGLTAAGGPELPASAGLVADDGAAAVAALHGGSPGTVAVLADNAGRELLADLMLVDHLLDAGLARHVVLHLKPRPWFVSDATPADLADCVRRLAAAGGAAGHAAERVRRAVGDGRLAVRAHPFAAEPYELRRMPADLSAELGSASLVLLKGDLNYRRLVGDRRWPATTPFAEVTAYFPAPVLAVRTLKSDVVVGLPAATVRGLDAGRPGWRTDGAHALLQLRT